MMENEEMQRLLTEPAVDGPAPGPEGLPPPVEATEAQAPPSSELLALLDAILGVGTDG